MSILQISPCVIDGNADKSRVFAEEHLSGYRCLIHFGKNLDRPYITGSKISVITGKYKESGKNIPHICNACKKISARGRDYTVIDGVLSVPGHYSKTPKRLMNCNENLSLFWQEEFEKLRFTATDILFSDGEDVRNYRRSLRRAMLGRICGELKVRSKFIDIIESLRCSEKMAIHHYYEKIIAQGGKGILLKSIEGCYGRGTAIFQYGDFMDVVIIGFTASESSNSPGSVGSLHVGLYDRKKLIEIGRCRVPDYSLRNELTSNYDYYSGKVAKITHNGWSHRGRLIYPKFIGINPEKRPECCLLAKERETDNGRQRNSD